MKVYPLRANGVVPRLQRKAKERVRGKFTQARVVFRRRSVRRDVSMEILANDPASYCEVVLGAGARPICVKVERRDLLRDTARVQICGMVPA